MGPDKEKITDISQNPKYKPVFEEYGVVHITNNPRFVASQRAVQRVSIDTIAPGVFKRLVLRLASKFLGGLFLEAKRPYLTPLPKADLPDIEA